MPVQLSVVERFELKAEIVNTGKCPVQWLVEAIDTKTGDVYSALFYGADALERARRYAADTFQEYREKSLA